MKQKKSIIVFITILLIASTSTSLLPRQSQEEAKEWWYIPFPESFNPEGFKNSLSFIHVEGNEFVDEQGNHTLFQGVNISDPDKLEKNGYWNKKHFEVIKDWGANIVRM